MIKISLLKPEKLTTFDKVISVAFDYNADVVRIIKERETRAYNPSDKSWEISPKEYKELINSLSNYKIEYLTEENLFIEESAKEYTKETPSIKPYISIRAALTTRIKESSASLFIKFPYNKDLVVFLKGNKGFFNSDNKEWEIDFKYLDKIKEFAAEKGLEVKEDNSIYLEIERIKLEKEKIVRLLTIDWDKALANYKFITKPYIYQLEGIKRGLQDRNLLLTDEQGLGKTLQALYIADIKAKEEGYKYTLIVCGVNGLKYNWLAEIEEHLGEEGYILGSRVNRNGNTVEGSVKERLEALDRLEKGEIPNRFIVTNIETLRNKDIKEKLRELTIKNIIGMTIIDEIHRVSNIKSLQGSALYYLKTRNKIGLTGTPLVNRPFDLYAPLKWLGIEERSEYEFKHRYGRYVTRYGQGREYEELIEFINIGELRDILSEVMLRREKKDVLDLPEVVYMQEIIELNKEQSTLYKEIRNELIDQIEDIVLDPNPLAKFTRLRQACSCTSALDSTITKNAKYERVLELIEDLKEDNKKTIVYSNFAFAINELNELFKANNIKSYKITGEEKNKKAVIDNFRENGDVLCGSVQVLGTGYTITEATTIIFLDLPWTYANYIQAVDRAHRIGQKNNITVISLLAKDTVDEKIYKIVKKKQDLFEDLMDGKDIKGVNRKKLTKHLLGV